MLGFYRIKSADLAIGNGHSRSRAEMTYFLQMCKLEHFHAVVGKIRLHLLIFLFIKINVVLELLSTSIEYKRNLYSMVRDSYREASILLDCWSPPLSRDLPDVSVSAAIVPLPVHVRVRGKCLITSISLISTSENSPSCRKLCFDSTPPVTAVV